MKILHVITTINRGGSENHLVDLVSGQLKTGATVSVAYLKGDGYWAERLSNLGCSVISLGLHRYGEIKPLLQLGKHILDFKPDIIHSHMPPAELYSRFAMLFFRTSCPFIISKHNDESFFSGWGQQAVARWVSSPAKRVIAISEAVNLYVKTHLKLLPHQVVTVHYGIDSKTYQEIAAEITQNIRDLWGIPDGILVFGTVARFVPQKALHLLLEAYAQYRTNTQRESRLVLVGRGPLERDLKRTSILLGIEHDVIWAGFRDDIQAVMQAFDCFVLTSKYEGFGLVLLEAMAAAKPIVATAVSAIPEVVVNGVTGLLCQTGDAESVAKALYRMEDEALRMTLGKAGKLRVESRFSIERMVDATMSIYRESL